MGCASSMHKREHAPVSPLTTVSTGSTVSTPASGRVEAGLQGDTGPQSTGSPGGNGQRREEAGGGSPQAQVGGGLNLRPVAAPSPLQPVPERSQSIRSQSADGGSGGEDSKGRQTTAMRFASQRSGSLSHTIIAEQEAGDVMPEELPAPGFFHSSSNQARPSGATSSSALPPPRVLSSKSERALLTAAPPALAPVRVPTRTRRMTGGSYEDVPPAPAPPSGPGSRVASSRGWDEGKPRTPPDGGVCSRRTTRDEYAALSEFGSLTGWQQIAAEVMMKEQSGPTAAGAEAGHEEELHRPTHGELMRWETIKTRPGLSFHADYTILEELGQGAYGKAFKAQRVMDGELVVVKQIATETMSLREKLETKQEVKVLAHMDHPNVVKYYSAYAEEKEMLIVMEYCEEGDLTKFLKLRKGKLLAEHQIMLRFVQVCLALHHVHEKGILHRDLKSSNIFCDTFSIVKLGDFGISKMMGADSQCRTIVGTPYYLSPEICEDKPYGVKSDMWSLGCVLYELCTLKHAFDGKSLPQLVLKILNGKFPPIASHYSDELKTLVNSLLARNPADRPSLTEIFKLGYMRDHLHRYVIHIKKHITKRKESFKRSVAKWDPNYMTNYADSLPDRSGTHAFQASLAGTIAKRQNSLLHSLEETAGATAQRPGTAPGGAVAGAKKQRAMSPDLFGTDKPPPRPRTADGRKVSINDVVEEYDDKEVTTRRIDLGQTESGDGEDGLDNFNMAQGMSLLKLGLPPSRFDGAADDESAAEEETTGGSRGAAVQALLPASRWSASGDPSPRGAYDRSISAGVASATSATSAGASEMTESAFQRSGGSTHGREEDQQRPSTIPNSASDVGSASNDGRPGTANENRPETAEMKEATIRRLMSAGATLGSAATVAHLADAMESSMGSNAGSEMSVPEKSYAGSSNAPDSRYVSPMMSGTSPMMSTDSPMMSNDNVYMRFDSHATETSTSNTDETGSSAVGGGQAMGSSSSSSAAGPYSLPAKLPDLTATPLKPLSPLKLVRELSTSGSFALRAQTVDRASSSSVNTPQFRVSAPTKDTTAETTASPVARGPEHSSPPETVGSLEHWNEALVPSTSDAAAPGSGEPAPTSASAVASEHALSRFAPSPRRSSGESAHSPLSRSPEGESASAGGAAADTEPTADVAPPATTTVAEQRASTGGGIGAGTRRASVVNDADKASARAAVAKAKGKYAEVKAQQEAAAAARAKAHREQLLAAKEAKEKAKATAQTQAALWVKMLKKRVENAKPKVPQAGFAEGQEAGQRQQENREAAEEGGSAAGRADAADTKNGDQEAASPSPQFSLSAVGMDEEKSVEGAMDNKGEERVAFMAGSTRVSRDGLSATDAARAASGGDSIALPISPLPTEMASFFSDLAEAGAQTCAIGRVTGVLDQVHELLGEPTTRPRILPTPSMRVMVDSDIEALQQRIRELHESAKGLLGEEVFLSARQYVWEHMNGSGEGEGEGHDTQAALLGIVGAANMAHLPLVLKAVKQELVYAEVVGSKPSRPER